MTKILIDTDCNNAPKKQYIKDFNIAFAHAELEKVSDMMSDDAVWVIIGKGEWSGKKDIKKMLSDMNVSEADELLLENILSHGKLCSANGYITYDKDKIAFSDVYEFEGHGKNVKIKKMTSYPIEIT